jgi:hypothetical protein
LTERNVCCETKWASKTGSKQVRITIAESTTTRTAGGLDFTAIGGKRQGREVPQSLKTTRFGKPNQIEIGGQPAFDFDLDELAHQVCPVWAGIQKGTQVTGAFAVKSIQVAANQFNEPMIMLGRETDCPAPPG